MPMHCSFCGAPSPTHAPNCVAPAFVKLMDAVDSLPLIADEVPLPWLVSRYLPGNQLSFIRCETEQEAKKLYDDWKQSVEALGGSVTVSYIHKEHIK